MDVYWNKNSNHTEKGRLKEYILPLPGSGVLLTYPRWSADQIYKYIYFHCKPKDYGWSNMAWVPSPDIYIYTWMDTKC